MKKSNLLILFSLLILACGEKKKEEKSEAKTPVQPNTEEVNSNNEKISETLDTNILVSGDIIFQTNEDHQSNLVSIVTQSPFTHCGVILKTPGGLLVLEANGTVHKTDLNEWIESGKDSKFIIMRLINYDQFQNKHYTQTTLKSIKTHFGKPYDSKFLWNDEEMYCSELVWKLFNEALGIQISIPKKFKDLDLSDPGVQEELKKRYGNNIPSEELIVSPADLAASDQLKMIYSNY